jgi:hypothetical protein
MLILHLEICRGHCKIQSLKDQGGETFFTAPPPGIAYLIAKSVPSFSWVTNSNRTGRFKYQQSSFDVNELVAALGVVQPGIY